MIIVYVCVQLNCQNEYKIELYLFLLICNFTFPKTQFLFSPVTIGSLCFWYLQTRLELSRGLVKNTSALALSPVTHHHPIPLPIRR